MSEERFISSPTPHRSNNIDKALSLVGSLEEKEREVLNSDAFSFGAACYKLAGFQSTIPQVMKWLKLGAEEEHKHASLAYKGLQYGLNPNPNLNYMGDELALWLKATDDDMLKQNFVKEGFDTDGSRARRHVVRTLLSGSLSKNQDSVLYRSFFRSGLREVHLLPLLSKYLVGTRSSVGRAKGFGYSVTSLVSLTPILLRDSLSVYKISINMTEEVAFLCFIPLLFSRFPNLKQLSLEGNGRKISLSLLHQVDTSKLEELQICSCSYESLSPLSLCDLSSLRSLCISRFPSSDCEEDNPLNGLSSGITKRLTELKILNSNITNISSSLSQYDLSSLEILFLSYNRSLSDLSPLQRSDLSSLTRLDLYTTGMSNLYPLSECKGLALEDLCLSRSPIEDLSPLSLLDLSRLREPIELQRTKVSDLTPLVNISDDGVVVDISDTPAAERMIDEGLTSPQMIGRVTVTWF